MSYETKIILDGWSLWLGMWFALILAFYIIKTIAKYLNRYFDFTALPIIRRYIK